MLTHELEVPTKVVAEGRNLIITTLNYYDVRERWPKASEITKFNSYYVVKDKAAMMQSCKDQGWLVTRQVEHGKYYIVTDKGRIAVTMPSPLSDVERPSMPLAFDSVVESRVHRALEKFFHANRRWPNAMERASFAVFKRDAKDAYKACESMRACGTLVLVKLRVARGTNIVYVDPRLSPEFKDADGIIFYAPTLRT